MAIHQTDEEIMAEFLETNSYDEVGDWRALPELGTADDESDFRAAGGPGSGNFGHSGRKGEVGGSGDEARTIDDIFSTQPRDRSTWAEYTDTNPDRLFTGSTSRSDLPPDQHHAVHEYVVHNSDGINGALRNGTDTFLRPRYNAAPSPYTITPELIANLDAATQTDVAEKDMIVYRAVEKDTFPSEPETVFSDKAYCSTSTNDEKAGLLGQMFHQDETVIWEVEVPKGTRFLDVAKHFDPDTDTHDEQEFLFGRDTQFEVIPGTNRLRVKQ